MENQNDVNNKDNASNKMKSVRQFDTKPELLIQKLLLLEGIGFEKNYCPINGVNRKADIAIVQKKIAIFIDGCFWHGCPDHGTWPKNNKEFWRKKIESNMSSLQ